MQKIKVSDATKHQINWLVAYAQGWVTYPSDSIERGQYYHTDSARAPHGHGHNRVHVDEFNPTTDWAQGGPILERAGIATRESSNGVWYAMLSSDLGDEERARWAQFTFKNGPKTASTSRECRFTGSSQLEAGLRCWVASKLGDVVDLPDELVKAKPAQHDGEEDSPPSPHERG